MWIFSIVNMNEPPSLLRNDQTESRAWLKVKLVGTRSNRSAIGAEVLCRYGDRRQLQTVLSQSSFFSANDPRLHFGLGTAKSVDLDVRWPSGLKQSFRGVVTNRIITLTEGNSSPVEWTNKRWCPQPSAAPRKAGRPIAGLTACLVIVSFLACSTNTKRPALRLLT